MNAPAPIDYLPYPRDCERASATSKTQDDTP